MPRNYTQLFLGIIIGLIIGLVIGKQIFVIQLAPGTNVTTTSQATTSPSQKNNAGINNLPDNNNSAIPQKVYEILKYIRANHRAMDGYVGGRVFTNREKIVPQVDSNGNSITYQEWDVKPKIKRQNRGTERILTGSDGRAWYTDDHYQSFKEIK
ncbi:MAG: ribonuclease domain-containing protein [Ginsengibacter sp.]